MADLRNTADIKFCNNIVDTFKSAINKGRTKDEAIECLWKVFRNQSMVSADVQYLYKNHPQYARYIECGVSTTIQVTGPQVGDMRVFEDEDGVFQVQSYRDCGTAGKMYIDETQHGFTTLEEAVTALPIVEKEIAFCEGRIDSLN